MAHEEVQEIKNLIYFILKNKIKILTFNVGLLNMELFGKSIILPAPFIEERLKELPKKLIKSGADIIGLQEIYEQKHREFLISKLKKHYPYHFFSRQQRMFRLEDSLMFFSKIPFTGKEVIAFKNDIFEEELFVYKGVLVARIRVDGFGQITFYNTHTTAGGIRNPQNQKVENIRNLQISQIIKSIHKHKFNISEPKIVIGDINAGPEVSKNNYNLFLKNGFIDAYKKIHPLSFKKTWDPKNFLNINGPHKNCPPQRIDHIFLREEDKSSLQIIKADIVFNKPYVKINSRKKVTLSDHYGLLVTLKLKR